MEKLSSSFKKKGTSIEDVVDELLMEIFVRLPSVESVMTAKLVSKRWLSLLSNPKFGIIFLNHKKNLPVPLKKPPWTFLAMQLINNEGMTRTNSPFHKVFNSPKFSFNFLPFPVEIVATFKDLVLCIDSSSNNDSDHTQYYICNPSTKQWVALPPTPVSWTETSWACLVCEDPFYNDIQRRIDYKFRVIVVVRPNFVRPNNGEYDPSFTLKLNVFCSENCTWMDIDLRVCRTPINPKCRVIPLRGVVCKGMVCVCYIVYFGLFDPFNVTPTTSTPFVEARTLPIHSSRGNLLECGGRLISLYHAKFATVYPTFAYYNGSYNKVKGDFVGMIYNELDLNEFIGKNNNNNNNNNNNEVRWKTYNVINFNQAKSPSTRRSDGRIINIHPTNNCLIYVLTNDNILVQCDIRGPSRLKILGEFRHQLPVRYLRFYSSTRFELQYWPTPVPWINPTSS